MFVRYKPYTFLNWKTIKSLSCIFMKFLWNDNFYLEDKNGKYLFASYFTDPHLQHCGAQPIDNLGRIPPEISNGE